MVSIVRCTDYNEDNVNRALAEALEPLGGMEACIKPGERVLIKPNLLSGAPPDKAVTTHPAIIAAVVEMVIKAGGKPVIADSPGGNVSEKTIINNLQTSGVYDAVKKFSPEKGSPEKGSLENDSPENDSTEKGSLEKGSHKKGYKSLFDTSGESAVVNYPEGKVIRNIPVMRIFTDVDKVINVCKMKTHSMMMFTGAVKNMFGLVTGRNKAEFHLRYTDYNVFADMLIDICSMAAPVLCIMDAITAMEGSGPANGKVRHVGLLLASVNAYKLDLAAVNLIGIEPEEVFTIKAAHNRNLAPIKPDEIEYSVEKPDNIHIPEFEKPWIGKLLNGWFGNPLNIFRPRPKMLKKKCKKCGVCVNNCPPGAMKMNNAHPEIDRKKCISCMCCQELCEYGAIGISKGFIIGFLKCRG